MVAAVMIAVGFMMVFAGAVGDFVHRHPTVKMLALSFLLMIGLSLVAEGFGQHIPKGYIYFAMAFSVFVEMLNLRVRHPPAPGAVSRNIAKKCAFKEQSVQLTRQLAFASMLLVLVPAPARADGFIVPFVGYNFGGDSGTVPA